MKVILGVTVSSLDQESGVMTVVAKYKSLHRLSS